MLSRSIVQHGSGVNDEGNLVSEESIVSTFINEWHCHQCDEASDSLNDEAIARC